MTDNSMPPPPGGPASPHPVHTQPGPRPGRALLAAVLVLAGSAVIGLAGGLINTTQQIGGAIGLAIITTVAAGHGSVVQSAAAADGGFRAGLLVAAGIAAAATVAAMWFPRRRASAAAVSVAGTGITSPAPAAAA